MQQGSSMMGRAAARADADKDADGRYKQDASAATNAARKQGSRPAEVTPAFSAEANDLLLRRPFSAGGRSLSPSPKPQRPRTAPNRFAEPYTLAAAPAAPSAPAAPAAPAAPTDMMLIRSSSQPPSNDCSPRDVDGDPFPFRDTGSLASYLQASASAPKTLVAQPPPPSPLLRHRAPPPPPPPRAITASGQSACAPSSRPRHLGSSSSAPAFGLAEARVQNACRPSTASRPTTAASRPTTATSRPQTASSRPQTAGSQLSMSSSMRWTISAMGALAEASQMPRECAASLRRVHHVARTVAEKQDIELVRLWTVASPLQLVETKAPPPMPAPRPAPTLRRTNSIDDHAQLWLAPRTGPIRRQPVPRAFLGYLGTRPPPLHVGKPQGSRTLATGS